MLSTFFYIEPYLLLFPLKNGDVIEDFLGELSASRAVVEAGQGAALLLLAV
jgi:hypothetical protein